MQIVCQSCGSTAEAADVRVRGTEVAVVCSVCGHEAPLNPPAIAAPRTDQRSAPNPVVRPAPIDPNLPPVKCPKCGHRQDDPKACHRCGLVFALVKDGQRPWERAPVGKEAAYAEAANLWTAIEANPGDEGRHTALAEFCRTNAMPAWAAMRYRHWLADYPEDELAKRFHTKAVADAQALARVYVRSDADLFLEQTKLLRNIVVGILVAMIILAGIIALRAMRTQPDLPF